MSRLTPLVCKLPGVPSMFDRGLARVSRRLNRIRGDADVILLAKGQYGWEPVPANIRDEGDEMWMDPVADDGRPYPADGVPDTPPELGDCPVVPAYKHYGCLNEVNNVVVDEPQMALGDLLEAAGVETDERGEPTLAVDPPNRDRSDDETRWQRLRAWPGRRWRGLKAWVAQKRRAYRYRRDSKGWDWMQRDATALVLKQDGDAAVYCERADKQQSSESEAWTGYLTRTTEDRYDDRGAGAKPEPIGDGDAKLALAFGPVVKLISPVACRVGRNIHAKRLATVAAPEPPDTGSGESTDGDGGDGDESGGDGGDLDQPAADARSENGHAVADGGGYANTRSSLPRHNDIMIEERAAVWPADIKKLGGENITQERLETAIKQIDAKRNPPGSQTLDKALKLGGIILVFILAMVLGDAGLLYQVAETISEAL